MTATMRGIAVALLLLSATSAAAADTDTDDVADQIAERNQLSIAVKALDRGDYTTALPAFRWLAEQGHAEAQYFVGAMYDLGQGVPEDDRQAVVWYRKAAEQGHASAQVSLGVMYDFGRGVPEDDRQAVVWYLKAAEQGHSGAQFNLGVMYDFGEGVPEDDRQAVVWYRKAAEQGDAGAQYNLGLLYAKGEGVPKDYVRAYAWFNLAAAQAEENAAEVRTLVRRLMTAAQIAEAQRLSRDLAARIESGHVEAAPSAMPDGPVPPPRPSREAVLQAQTYLALLGYDPGPLDGWQGERTTAAVRRFQSDLDMTPTGQISEALLLLLVVAASDPQEEPAEPERSGSGFTVGAHGEVVTNHHVVDGCARVAVGRSGETLAATVRATDAANDLALLEAPRAAGTAATFSRSPRARLGAAVTVAGYPLHGFVSRALNVTRGSVSAMVGLRDDARLLQITAPVQSGNSGGPVLDAAGNVIGVVASKLDAVHAARSTGDVPQNVNFAIKGALVRGFLDIHGVDYRRRAVGCGALPDAARSTGAWASPSRCTAGNRPPRGDVAVAEALHVERGAQVAVVDAHVGVRSEDRLGAVGDADAGGGEHGGVVGAVADRHRVTEVETSAPAPRAAGSRPWRRCRGSARRRRP